MSHHPLIIQGGMGAGVSNWRLARAVSERGQLGVVSGTALAHILARRLQDGDPGGHMGRGLDHCPLSETAERIWRKYHIPGGKAAHAPYKPVPMLTKNNSREYDELCIVANFVEVFLAREGHGNAVGINYLEKIQLPHLSSIFGAMLAGVDFVIMGAGIPLKIPGILDRFVNFEPATYPLQVAGAPDAADATMTFVPREFMEHELPPLLRPKFLAIVASNTLAVTMLKKANGKVDGLVIEGPTAGGHNAPPRGKLQLSETGEPIYGERDRVDLDALCALGVPFWLAGGYGTPEKVREALAAGATGVQVGTAFALCVESGLRDDYKQAILQKVAAGEARVFTDPLCSPTGFPFKVVQLEGSGSEAQVYLARVRLCDLGYLREAYTTDDGAIAYRCSAEPENNYARKAGTLDKTLGRKCICNALLANIGQSQVRQDGHNEEGLVTAGDDLVGITRFLPPNGSTAYNAADVIAMLCGSTLAPTEPVPSS
ncbi:MAG: nitronate monooxygenase [Candidatus Korobacteraceae bacterium]|jgi:nitronate monooxygenase